MEILRTEKITMEFTAAGGEPVVALKDISISVADQEFVALLGPSGCGKTTLLRIIAGLSRPTSGNVILGNEVITRPDPRMVMIFQEYSLYPWRTVEENITFGLELRDVPPNERARIAQAHLDLIGLAEFADHYPYELSGGMRQRVAVARALAVNPKVLLMDEPFGALDAQTRNRMQRELLDIREKTKKTILFVTHSVDEAVFLADRMVVLSSRPGMVKEEVTIPLSRPRDRTSAEFASLRRYVLDLIDEGEGAT